MEKFNCNFKKVGDGEIQFSITQQTKEFYNGRYLNEVSAFLREEGFAIRLSSIAMPELRLEEGVFYLRGSDTVQDKDIQTIYVEEGRDTDALVEYLNNMVEAIQRYTNQEQDCLSPIVRKIKSLDRRFKAKSLRKVKVEKLPLGA